MSRSGLIVAFSNKYDMILQADEKTCPIRITVLDVAHSKIQISVSDFRIPQQKIRENETAETIVQIVVVAA